MPPEAQVDATGLHSSGSSEPKKASRTLTEDLRSQKVLMKSPIDEEQETLGHAAQVGS